MTIKSKVAGAIATCALFASMAPVALASDNIVVVAGNGAASINKVVIGETSSSTVNQSNSSTVLNDVSNSASTGGNTASANTGGNTGISTGAATASVDVAVAGNSNNATLGCGCVLGGGNDVAILGNGTLSYNKVTISKFKTSAISQSNSSLVANSVYNKAKTGKNGAYGNTGGLTGIATGPAAAWTGIVVLGSTNSLNTP